jgi:hypothetical protein
MTERLLLLSLLIFLTFMVILILYVYMCVIIRRTPDSTKSNALGINNIDDVLSEIHRTSSNKDSSIILTNTTIEL